VRGKFDRGTYQREYMRKWRAKRKYSGSRRGRPRLEDLGFTNKATEPWKQAGMSERTWYRRRAQKRGRDGEVMEPTAHADMCAELMRRWYEKNRECWWERHKPGIIGASPDRSGLHADEFMLRLMGEASRIEGLSDVELSSEY
jgi:hypothetical protein